MKKLLFLLVLISFNCIILNAQRRLDFVPATHGFHFQNNFTSHNGFVHTSGLCGGMSLAAFNYFRYNIPIPPQRNADMNFNVNFDLGLRTSGADALTDYIFQSQIATFTNISVANFIGPLDPDYITEFNKVKARIDRGEYLLLGLKEKTGGLGHQVLVYGYDPSGSKIFVYDPNEIDVESVITPFVDNGQKMILLTSTAKPNEPDRRFKAIFEEQELFRNITSPLTQYNWVSNGINNYNFAIRPPLAAVPSNSSQGFAITPGAIYKILNANSKKAIEVKNYSRDNGAEICQWDFHGGDNQLWKLEDAGEGFYYIRSVLTGKNLEVYGFSTDNGGRVSVWDNTAAKNQQWGIKKDPVDGNYILTNRNSGKVVDINGASRDNAGVVQQWQNVNGLNQKFMIEIVR